MRRMPSALHDVLPPLSYMRTQMHHASGRYALTLFHICLPACLPVMLHSHTTPPGAVLVSRIVVIYLKLV